MNQEKIGKFILKLRKEKNMTQQELADKIGVTDRAISKWENGRGMPDLSLMKPLCDELGITINELISGENLDKKEYKEKSDENIINTISYSDKKIKKTKTLFKVIVSILIIIFVSLAFMFIVDVRRMNENKPVVFSTWGFLYTPAIDLNDDEIYLAIRNYLVEKGDSEEKHNDLAKTFVSMRVYLLEEEKRDSLYYVYAWVVEGKYYLENDILKQDSGYSIPFKFKVIKNDSGYRVVDSRIPRDGSYYSGDMKNIFPRSVRNDMKNVHTDGTIDELIMEVEEQAKLYFHK
ncbi:MAG: helix-turn-helix domain-containing protein [Bacilli bacterium]|nr:helix-turn-helix domain-containing protein [Bacilli bacterium]